MPESRTRFFANAGEFRFVNDSCDIAIIIVCALDLVEELLFTSLDADKPASVLLLGNNHVSVMRNLGNWKSEIIDGIPIQRFKACKVPACDIGGTLNQVTSYQRPCQFVMIFSCPSMPPSRCSNDRRSVCNSTTDYNICTFLERGCNSHATQITLGE